MEIYGWPIGDDNFIFGTEYGDWMNGRGGDDVLFGNAGMDVLNGGIGRDILNGGTGDDAYILSPTKGNWDWVTDWDYDSDRVIVGGSASNTIERDQMVYGTKSLDENDRIIYDLDTGRLWYDEDGKGGEHKVKIAVFSDDNVNAPIPHLWWNDFFIP